MSRLQSAGWLGAASLVLSLAAASALAQSPGGVTIQPNQGSIGSTVRLTAGGIPPSTDVQIMGGPDKDHLATLGMAKSDPQGKLSTQAKVPDTAKNGQDYIFGISASGAVSTAEPFHVGAKTQMQHSGFDSTGGPTEKPKN